MIANLASHVVLIGSTLGIEQTVRAAPPRNGRRSHLA
jgi:hypothetical protein